MKHTKLNQNLALWLAGLSVAFFASSGVFAQSDGGSCGLLSNGNNGPFDYRTDRDKYLIVTGAHFRPEVEMLIRGTTGEGPGGDLSYTLRAIPNNHRALIAMMRLGEKVKTPRPSGSQYTIECWFDRAVRFRPDDSIVRMIYSTYLNKNGRAPEATTQLEIATTYAKDSAFTHYNIGLHYFDLKNYEKALIQAHKAIELDFTQTALRDKLQSVGKWTEPAASTTVPAIESPSSAPKN